MAFLETKGMLARLLATENLIVEHDAKAETACFNVDTRVMTLPILNTQSEHIYNLFVGHECGHALETPKDFVDSLSADVPHSFVNVIEDVRIEKHIQKKFPGLRVDFTRGYNEMMENDFFEIQDKDPQDLNLIDRINIHFKAGVMSMMPFSAEEMEMVDLIDSCETFEDVIAAAKALAAFLNHREEKIANSNAGGNDTSGNPSSGSGDSKASSPSPDNSGTSEETPEQNDSNEGEGESASNGESPSDSPAPENQSAPSSNVSTGSTSAKNEYESLTQEALDKALKRLAENLHNKETVYVNAPDVKLSDYVTPIEWVRNSFNESKRLEGFDDFSVKAKYQKFLNDSRSSVNFMVQQFEMRKSADAYARSTQNKTGVLNTQKLHNYKLTDDIFLRQTVTPSGKNHGLVLMVDWSGSMQDTALAVVKQVLVLVQFCRKVQIPYVVYTFTTGGYKQGRNSKPNEVSLRSVDLVEVISSSQKRGDIDTDMYHLFCTAYSKSTYTYGGSGKSIPNSGIMHMGGTPLNCALFAVPAMVKKFRSETKAQKVSFVCLTDGESSPLEVGNKDGNPKVVYSSMQTPILRYNGSHTFVLNTTSDRYSNVEDTTGRIGKWLSIVVPEMTVTHIFMGGAKATLRYLSSYYNSGVVHSFRMAEFDKEGSFHFPNKDYWESFVMMNPSQFSDSPEEIQCDDGATKGQVRTALKKFLKRKTCSRKMLAELVTNFA